MTYCITDKNIRYGKLPSGLTYYIRHNETPKELACFYLVKNVGSIIEEDNERGFAHFLEHMSFEGSLNFPDDGMTRYLESIGVRFGEENNAYTSAEETVYSIKNVPVSRDNCLNCLRILIDWICGLTLKDEAVEIEKGIVLEEFRVSSSPMYRMMEKMFAKIYEGSRYADRSILGKYDVIKNFDAEKLREFYRKWSRPDLSAIVIIGDFDADEMEEEVKSLDFNCSLYSAGNTDTGDVAYSAEGNHQLKEGYDIHTHSASIPERVEFMVADNEKPVIAVEKDSEQTIGRLALFIKKDVYDREYIKTYECLRDAYIVELILRMLNSRYMFIANSNSAPIVDPYVSVGDFILAKTKRAIDIWVDMDMEKFDTAFMTTYRELLRSAEYGFSETELQKAKKGWMSSMQSQYIERTNRKSFEFAEEYVKHFTRYEPIPSIDDEYAFAVRTIPEITLDEVNNVMASLYDGTNLVVSCFLPESSVVSEQHVKDLMDIVDNEKILRPDKMVYDIPLISNLPVKGKVVSTENFVYGYRKLVLSNGSKVYLKTTDFAEDEILLYAVSPGGKYNFDVSMFRELFAAEQIPEIGGLAVHSKQQLYSLLEDKQLDASTIINPLLCSVKGNCSRNDIKEMMEVVYLMFSSPRYDEESFQIWKQKVMTMLKNNETNFLSETMKMINREVFKYSEFYNKIHSGDVESIVYEKAYELYRECFSDPSSFSFIITGNIQQEDLVPLLEQYIASIPVPCISSSSLQSPISVRQMNRMKEIKNLHHIIIPGSSDITSLKEMESPSAYSITVFTKEVPKSTQRDIVLSDLLVQTMDMDVVSEIRQKDGDAYMAYADGNVSIFSPSISTLYLILQTNAGNEKEINEKVDMILDKYVRNGPSEDNLLRCKEYSKKKYNKDMETNQFFQSKLSNYLISGLDEITSYESLVDSITTDELKSYASQLVLYGNKKRCTISAE